MVPMVGGSLDLHLEALEAAFDVKRRLAITPRSSGSVCSDGKQILDGWNLDATAVSGKERPDCGTPLLRIGIGSFRASFGREPL